jgi:hypothetical protein
LDDSSLSNSLVDSSLGNSAVDSFSLCNGASNWSGYARNRSSLGSGLSDSNRSGLEDWRGIGSNRSSFGSGLSDSNRSGLSDWRGIPSSLGNIVDDRNSLGSSLSDWRGYASYRSTLGNTLDDSWFMASSRLAFFDVLLFLVTCLGGCDGIRGQ